MHILVISEVSARDERLIVFSGCNAYYLYDTHTCREACMGDGVDVITQEEIGTEAFRRAWQKDANASLDVYLEAYFGIGRDASRQRG